MQLDSRRTALVLIDLQGGIVGMPLAPRSGPAVVEGAKALAAAFRAAGALVVLVHVGWASDYSDAPQGLTDQAPNRPAGGLPPAFTRFAEGLEQPGDIRLLKRNWGAFGGTELDTLLRRRGVDTIVLGGIATNFGVDSTARQAWELNYSVIVAEDLCASVSAPLHAMAVEAIFPRIARVVRAQDLAFG